MSLVNVCVIDIGTHPGGIPCSVLQFFREMNSVEKDQSYCQYTCCVSIGSKLAILYLYTNIICTHQATCKFVKGNSRLSG
ncbi:hypothetical protein R5R35_004472 [Gryllus longicercus]|uniref:Uncharacterized protein n=1 Tax=Gryllus longicercus TaxID=2509291 RepID=A0AAN9Z1U9_9ORTH